MKNNDFFEDYVTIKSDQLIEMMNNLIEEMSQKKCNVRHFKQWEANMTSFREEYHQFQSQLLNQINDIQDKKYAKELEEAIAPICDQLEDHYEMLASIYLSKADEIKAKTTYFENRQTPSRPKKNIFEKIKLPKIKIIIQKRK